jgi:hypothetical protein
VYRNVDDGDSMAGELKNTVPCSSPASATATHGITAAGHDKSWTRYISPPELV